MGKAGKTILGLIVLLIVVWAIYQLSSTRTVQEEVANEPVKIGFMAPLTGDVASYGQSIREGVYLAIADLGLEGKVELIEEDTQCDPQLSTNAASKLVSADGVVAIVGETCSSATLAAAPIAEEGGVVMISPSSTSPDIAASGNFIFRTVPSDALQGAFGAKLVSDLGIERLGVLYMNDDYGNGFKDVLLEEVPKLGGHVVAAEAIDRGATDARGQLTKIKAQNPDGLYLILSSEATIGAAVRQVKELEMNVTLIGSEGLNSLTSLEPAGEAADGLLVTSVTAGTSGFLSHFEDVNGKAPGVFAAQAYDAFYGIGMAIKSGAMTSEEIRDYLYNNPFDGATGRIDFDEKGEVTGNYDVLIFDAEAKTFTSTSAEELNAVEELSGNSGNES